jgi:hypothetical protein
MLSFVCFSKSLYLRMNPHGVTTQKTNINSFTAMKTSNLIKFFVQSIQCKPKAENSLKTKLKNKFTVIS